MQGKRITGEKANIKYSEVEAFFAERSANKKLSHRYNYVLYQDECPELAIERDKSEKDKIAPYLGTIAGKRALDIGCGIGRWGEYLLECGASYVGIELSDGMIKIAEDNLSQYKNKKLLVGKAQDMIEILKKAGETEPFEIILVNGVFMYLNDADLEVALKDVYSLCALECVVYLKESLGIKERLTLDNIHSEGLSQDYSAIYRSIDEYRENVQKAWGETFKIEAEGELFKEDLQNHKETTDYFYILKQQNI